MALESFYGGKPGFSPVIKARFKYINSKDPAYQAAVKNNNQDIFEINSYTMDECFSDPNYTDVWYGELCIIDTDNKMNPNNGKLYRRTLKKNDDDEWTSAGNTLYAEYIGQIVGPSGGIPNFDLGNLNMERQKAVGMIETLSSDSNLLPFDVSNWEYTYPTKDETGKTIITNEIPPVLSDEEGRKEGRDYNVIQILDAGGTDESAIDLVPGKYVENGQNQYNDTIKYTWCNVRRNLGDSNTDAWFYLGFQIPYTSFDVNAIEENYTYGGDVFIDKSMDLETGNPEHPFYRNYEFHIPRGTRGIGPEEIFVVGIDDKTKPTPLYSSDAIHYMISENDTEEEVKDIEGNIVHKDMYYIPEGTEEIQPKSSTYWVAKWRLFNPKTVKEKIVYQYLVSYKDIRGVELKEDGSLIFTYSDNTPVTMEEKLKWIKDITFNTDRNLDDYGKLEITLNNNSVESWTVPLVKEISVDNDTRKIKVEYTNETNEIGIINSIERTWVDPRGHLLILYTSSEYRPTNSPQEKDLSENDIYYRQFTDPNGTYKKELEWVRGTQSNKIDGTDDVWWHDLGVVSTSIVTNPKIVVSYDAAANEPPLTSIDEISSALKEFYPTGQIEIGGTVIEGGLVAVENIPTGKGDGVTQDEGNYIILPDEGNLNKYETRIFYYDYNKGKWTDLGPFGPLNSNSINSDSNIYLEGHKSGYTENDNNTYVSDDGEHTTYSLSGSNNPELYFTSDQQITYSSKYNTYVPSGNINSSAILGNGINLFSFVGDNSNDIIDGI